MPERYEKAVWFVFNPPRQPTFLPVKTPSEAKQMIDKLASAMLVTDAIVANAFGLVQWDGQEWIEWESENGEQIDEWQMF